MTPLTRVFSAQSSRLGSFMDFKFKLCIIFFWLQGPPLVHQPRQSQRPLQPQRRHQLETNHLVRNGYIVSIVNRHLQMPGI